MQFRTINLLEGVPDDLSWNLTNDGQYSMKSTYKAQFYGGSHVARYRQCWKIWAPPKVKFFFTPKVKFFAWMPLKISLDRRLL
jgi:hypothetical protein